MQAAAVWFRRTAEQGVTEAQHHLGILYADGTGVPHDLILAYMLVNLAATNRNPDAIHNREVIGARLSPMELAQAQDLSTRWKPGTPLPTSSTQPAESQKRQPDKNKKAKQ